MDGLGQILALLGVEASHGDTAVSCEVDVPLADEVLHLRLREARIREHADLIEDVLPAARDAEGAQCCKELLHMQQNVFRDHKLENC